ncbi:MAG: hypothetical protein WA902_04395 [Thermosynechococcaceae cyanobacterium]
MPLLVQSCLRLPIGAALSAQVGPEGCQCWFKEGHLKHLDLDILPHLSV